MIIEDVPKKRIHKFLFSIHEYFQFLISSTTRPCSRQQPANHLDARMISKCYGDDIVRIFQYSLDDLFHENTKEMKDIYDSELDTVRM